MFEIIIIIALILANAVLSMAEIALVSARKTNLQVEAEKGSRKASRALKLISDPNGFLSAVQMGMTLVGILTGIFSGNRIADEFARVFMRAGMGAAGASTLAKTIIVIVVMYFTIVFGELVPKRIAMSAPEKVAKNVSGITRFISVIATPFVWILSKTTSLIAKMLHLHDGDAKVSEDEIKLLIQEGTEDGEVSPMEQDIVENVFAMGDLKVNTIMTHRSEIVWLELGMDRDTVRAAIVQNLFEEYPVADGDLDHVVGVLTLKDFVLNVDNPAFDLEKMVSPAVYFHENMNVYTVLEEMKAKKISRALICDEFGLCSGIITLKDIIEGLVGNVSADDEPDIVERTGENEGWLVEGQCSIYDFLRYFNLDDDILQDAEFTTVAGLILDQLGHIPVAGEKVRWKNYIFEVVDMDGVRIDKVIVSLAK